MYELINDKVFFWVEEERLHRLLGARDYRTLEHDVLTLNSAEFIPAYAEKIWLCHMNSGNTWPIPHRRDTEIFHRIADYPVKPSGKPVKNVVELVVDYSVPNIADYVVEIRRMRCSEVLKVIGKSSSTQGGVMSQRRMMEKAYDNGVQESCLWD